ncbi:MULTISPECIES: DUF3780 domain-containing protein [Bacillus]|uniref:DUF3780 domain-containing protein n=1 Tax=Bacillus TaxID=1386 RepID=UPI001C805E2D|nr:MULTISPECIES: DUF3780 domain-containing protein [Bacillus]BCC61103.1 hypothetical protein BCJMU10_4411 [Bacillus cereus]
MSKRKTAIGFGFVPEQGQYHFLVAIPKNKDEKVYIYERFEWQKDVDIQKIDEKVDKPKAQLAKYKWKQIEESLKKEFNDRLKKNNTNTGKWKVGQVPVERLFGKETLLLVWAIEDCDPSIIPVAIRNWLGLSPEERWWLFTMTNASSGGLNDKYGWRKAIRYALTENPVEEKNQQQDLFDLLFEKKNEGI